MFIRCCFAQIVSEMQQNLTASNESESLSDSPVVAAGSTGVKREADVGNERIEKTEPKARVVYMQPRSKARVVPPPAKVKSKAAPSGLISFRLEKSAPAAKVSALRAGDDDEMEDIPLPRPEEVLEEGEEQEGENPPTEECELELGREGWFEHLSRGHQPYLATCLACVRAQGKIPAKRLRGKNEGRIDEKHRTCGVIICINTVIGDLFQRFLYVNVHPDLVKMIGRDSPPSSNRKCMLKS